MNQSPTSSGPLCSSSSNTKRTRTQKQSYSPSSSSDLSCSSQPKRLRPLLQVKEGSHFDPTSWKYFLSGLPLPTNKMPRSLTPEQTCVLSSLSGVILPCGDGQILFDKFFVCGSSAAVFQAHWTATLTGSSKAVVAKISFRFAIRKKTPFSIIAGDVNNHKGILHFLHSTRGFPAFYGHFEALPFSICLTELLGPSLKDLIHLNRELLTFNFSWVASRAIEVLRRLHEAGYAHLDISPGNLLLDLNLAMTTESSLYLIDFQQAHPCKSLGPKQFESFMGTPLYASIPAHECAELGFASDLESLCYVLEHIYSGSLPWIDMLSLNDLSESKQKFSSNNGDIEALFQFSRKLSQSALPPYDEISHLFGGITFPS